MLRAAPKFKVAPLRLLQQAGQGVDRCRGRPSTQHMRAIFCIVVTHHHVCVTGGAQTCATLHRVPSLLTLSAC